jgi:hypothetical protein
MTNDLTTNDNADIAALNNAAENISTGEFVGIPLKFKKGEWLKILDKKRTLKVTEDEPFIVDTKSYANGWIKWESGRPTHKFVYRPIDGWIMPVRERLPDTDESLWPRLDGKPQDPWQENHQIVLKSLHETMDDETGVILDDLLTWTATGYFARKALKKLIKDYARDAKKHPGQMPVVLLKVKLANTSFGELEVPVFEIIDWREFGDDGAPPGSPGLHDTTHLAALRAALPDEESDNDLVDVTPARPAIAKRDMDDEIPF